MRAARNKPPAANLLGVAFRRRRRAYPFDARGKNFVLCGGSEETHAVMQETATKINEHLDRRGQRLEDVSIREFALTFASRSAAKRPGAGL